MGLVLRSMMCIATHTRAMWSWCQAARNTLFVVWAIGYSINWHCPIIKQPDCWNYPLGNPAISSQGDEPAQTTEMVAIVCHYDREIMPVTQRFTKKFCQKANQRWAKKKKNLIMLWIWGSNFGIRVWAEPTWQNDHYQSYRQYFDDWVCTQLYWRLARSDR